MKKGILSFVISILFIGNALSQVKKVNIDIFGDFEVVVKVGNGTVTVSSTGEIVDVDMNGSIDYFSTFDKSKDGKLSTGKRLVNSGRIAFYLKGGY